MSRILLALIAVSSVATDATSLTKGDMDEHFKRVFPHLDTPSSMNPGNVFWGRSPAAFRCEPDECIGKPGVATPATIGLHTEVLLEIKGEDSTLPDVKCAADESFEAVATAYARKHNAMDHAKEIAAELEKVARAHGKAWTERSPERNTEPDETLQRQFGRFTQELRAGVVQGGSEFATGAATTRR